MKDLLDAVKQWKTTSSAKHSTLRSPTLRRMEQFGSNPGDLSAWTFLPRSLKAGAPLVVVLHGCTQTAADYDVGSGWSKLASEYGFALLFPEQTRANNPNLCFNWFQVGDTTRNHGEVHSISQMIATLSITHQIDPTKIYVTGLSAGGAMAAAMMATYPELFKGGAIIAGLPYGVAKSIPEALERMRGHGLASNPVLADRVRKASAHDGPWPTLSVWHGTADKTVDQKNMEAIIGQWRELQGTTQNPPQDMPYGHTIRTWHDGIGAAVIEAHAIEGMGHGTPIKGSGDYSYGSPRPFMLDVGISSTWYIANGWGLLGEQKQQRGSPEPWLEQPANKAESHSPLGIRGKIEEALRAARLMK